MFQGDVTPAGQWMRDQRGLQLPADRVDSTVRTELRGNSEYAVTQSGKRVRLRTPQGLTGRGQQVYTRPEITVEVPAIQEGTNAKGDTYELETTKVYTENEFPEIGELFRRARSQEEGMRAVTQFFKDQFEEDDFMLEESAQVWRYDRGRDFLFRIRRMVDNELQVDKIPMRHQQRLRYDWLHLPGMLPEALEIGGNCVVKQVAQNRQSLSVDGVWWVQWRRSSRGWTKTSRTKSTTARARRTAPAS